jgi:hypothetical protein
LSEDIDSKKSLNSEKIAVSEKSKNSKKSDHKSEGRGGEMERVSQNEESEFYDDSDDSSSDYAALIEAREKELAAQGLTLQQQAKIATGPSKLAMAMANQLNKDDTNPEAQANSCISMNELSEDIFSDQESIGKNEVEQSESENPPAHVQNGENTGFEQEKVKINEINLEEDGQESVENSAPPVVDDNEESVIILSENEEKPNSGFVQDDDSSCSFEYPPSNRLSKNILPGLSFGHDARQNIPENSFKKSSTPSVESSSGRKIERP